MLCSFHADAVFVLVRTGAAGEGLAKLAVVGHKEIGLTELDDDEVEDDNEDANGGLWYCWCC